MPNEITDPSLLAQLNATDTSGPKEVTDPHILAQLNGADAPAHDPTEGMSTGEKFTAGVGKSMVDTGRGIYQLGASLGHAMGIVPDEKMRQIQKDADDSKSLDEPLMHTGAGMAGDIAGGAAQIAAVPEMLPAKFASAYPKLSALANAAGSGAIFSGAQPVSSDESRGTNAALGAAGGAGGELFGKALSFIAQPLKSALSDAGKKAVDALQNAGVPLDLAQQTGSRVAQTLKNIIADNPLIGASAFPEEQGKAFNRAVLKTMGIHDPAVTAADDATLNNGRQAIKGVMNDVADRNPIQYDDHLESELARIEKEAPTTLTADDMGPFKANLNNIVESAANNNGVIPGRVYQKLQSNIGALSKNPKYAPVMHEVGEALDDALQRSAGSDDQSALATARKQYRAMKQIEGAVDPATGDISPAKLLTQINTKSNRNQSLYGQGDQTLVNLAKAGKNVLAPNNPNSGTARRLAGMAAMGAVAGGGDEILHGDPKEAAKVAIAGAGLPLIGRQLVENPKVVKAVTGWNNSPAIKGLTDTVTNAAAAGVPAAINANRDGDLIERASGGKVDIDSLVDRLVSSWKKAKKATDQTTKPLLNVPDSVIVKALDIAQEHL
jgi:hypothetical protein